MYDLIIIGGGPAGITAAIYAKRAGLKFIIIECGGTGGQILSTYEIDNYPGLYGYSGMQLGTAFSDHLKSMETEVLNEKVLRLENGKDIKTVYTENNIYEARNILLATGASHIGLGIAREEELTGQGISYCATCDGAFYKGMDVAVIGGGDVALGDALYLSRMCKSVYVIHRREEFRAAASLVQKAKNTENISFMTNYTVEEYTGEDELAGLVLKNALTGEKTELSIDGVFVAIGMKPNTELLKGLVSMDEKGYIIADESCKTDAEGIYVAGDIRKKPLRQVVTAVADGANAIQSMLC